MDVFNRPGHGSRGDGRRSRNAGPKIFMTLLVIGLAALAGAGALSAAAERGPAGRRPAVVQQAVTPPPTNPAGSPATAEQIQAAQAAWSTTRHANTYDNGMGANTTCASCKSPQNWDPTRIAATEAAHDCASCKREPGQPRPELPGGVPVAQADWKSITCAVCHQPVGNSFSTSVSWWNQETGKYEPVANTTELCNKCHSGSHGFDVVFEQASSAAHKGWDCTKCHGSHGETRVTCTGCHDVTKGRAAAIHAGHPETRVNCTACHDAGGLPIWQDPLPGSRHFGQFIGERMAHTLRSWPSHNIQTVVDCRKCHHPQGDVRPGLPPLSGLAPQPVVRPALSGQVGCTDPACHSTGATFEWCPKFPRDPTPAPEGKAQ